MEEWARDVRKKGILKDEERRKLSVPGIVGEAIRWAGNQQRASAKGEQPKEERHYLRGCIMTTKGIMKE